jgi:hypothetical protein
VKEFDKLETFGDKPTADSTSNETNLIKAKYDEEFCEIKLISKILEARLKELLTTQPARQCCCASIMDSLATRILSFFQIFLKDLVGHVYRVCCKCARPV